MVESSANGQNVAQFKYASGDGTLFLLYQMDVVHGLIGKMYPVDRSKFDGQSRRMNAPGHEQLSTDSLEWVPLWNF